MARKKSRSKTAIHINGQPGALFPVAAIFVYLLVSAVAHLLWEIGQLRFYTLSTQGTRGEKIFAVLHCTAGDVLIAFFALVAALMIAGKKVWPTHQFWRVGVLTLVFGLGYTVFSEWLNVYVRGSWAYTKDMPTLPPFGTGLTPVLQWLIIPILTLLVVKYSVRVKTGSE